MAAPAEHFVVRRRARGAHRADDESVVEALHDAECQPPAGPQCGGGQSPAAPARTAHVDDRCGRGRGVDRAGGGAGVSRVQPSSSEGAQLLSDNGAPGGDHAHPARQESVGQRPRWEGGGAVSARPLDSTDADADEWSQATIPHGWGLFRQNVLRWLQARGVGYAIKVPFHRWLDLQQSIRAQPTWVPVAPNVTGFTIPRPRRRGRSRWR